MSTMTVFEQELIAALERIATAQEEGTELMKESLEVQHRAEKVRDEMLEQSKAHEAMLIRELSGKDLDG